MGKISVPSLHPFAGIAEKLNRTQENISNLESEIRCFLDESEYPVLSYDNQQLIAEAIKYHSERPIPLRFSVLAGEIIHHLRSCLDHIIWQFSDVSFREDPKKGRYVEFPILDKPPTDVFTQYERKIQGISPGRAAVRSRIEQEQPYIRGNPNESLLLAIHNMDIMDKHRELVIIASTGAAKMPPELWRRYESGELPLDTVSDNFKRHGQFIPEVAFSDFRGTEPEIVVQALGEMYNEVLRIVEAFDKLR